MKICIVALSTAATFVLISPTAGAEEIVVDQKDKNFSIRHLKVKAGDKVQFRNSDAYFHNVFSMSDAKTFDLGSYPQGKAKTVTFEQPGVVEVECAIHPAMKMVVEVSK